MRLFGIGLMPAKEDYLASLGQMTTLVGEAAHTLVEMFGDECGEGDRYAAHIKTIEHACDEVTHSISTRLSRSFITAIDREDIHALSTALDDIVDFIEAIASAVVMYGVQEYTPFMRMFAGVIQQMSAELDLLVPTLDRPKDLGPQLLKLHEFEREGDEIYRAGMAELFRGTQEVPTVIILKDLYENLEATVDRCQHVGDLVERIVIKNT
ncbi:MAG: phosphate transport system protein [Blastocatellia bacterium]|nr:phosphate transport system protein [Blastocatellia bacterium]